MHRLTPTLFLVNNQLMSHPRLKLTGNAGLDKDKVEKLRAKTRELLSHDPGPSLVHGDLWGGNKSFCKDGGKVKPVIFDPATYYGDREVDVAMTYVFGGFNNDFYEGTLCRFWAGYCAMQYKTHLTVIRI